MENRKVEYYLQALDLSPGYRWLRDGKFMLGEAIQNKKKINLKQVQIYGLIHEKF